MADYQYNFASDAGAERRLNALIAALNELDQDMQVPALRQYLEYGLDRMEGLEDAFYAFLADCAKFAAENLQDIRLLDIERRLGEIEHPEAPPFGQVLLSAALEFAVQSLTLSAAEGLANIVLSYMSNRALSVAMRSQYGDYIAAAKGVQKKMDTLKATFKNLKSEESSLHNFQEKLPEIYESMILGKIKSINLAGPQTIIPLNSPTDVVNVYSNINTRLNDIAAQKILTGNLVRGKLEDAAKINDLVKEYEGKLNGEAMKRKTGWDDFINGAKGSTYILNPINSILTKTYEWEQGRNQIDDNVILPYLGSTTTSKFLAWIRTERLVNAEQYSALRQAVRYTAETDVKNNTLIQNLAWTIIRVLPELDRINTTATVVRPMIVLGFEAAYWREYLQSNGFLDARDSTYIESVASKNDSEISPGDFVEGHIIGALLEKRQYFGAPGTDYEYETVFYPGVLGLTELQAELLYNRFAKAFYTKDENKAKLPFDYDETNYANVCAMPEWLYMGFIFNTTRKTRLDEMRLMVVLYFMQVSSDTEIDNDIKFVLGEAKAVGITPWMSQLSTGIFPDLASAVEQKENLIDGANALQAVLSLSQDYQAMGLEIKLSKLNKRIYVLNSDITYYLMLSTNLVESAELPGEISLQDLASRIDQEKLDLSSDYDEILNETKSNKEISDEVLNFYADRISKLLLWDPNAPDDKTWKIYGPVLQEDNK